MLMIMNALGLYLCFAALSAERKLSWREGGGVIGMERGQFRLMDPRLET